ncbi:hypothetical protein TRFO_16775 [Tritrichomonas foetus]|uniref:Protein kinase domain-containing protein n=1 Tax=Tritrichomonas foetus TaxID=1144522 RepID=A0A1J4KQL2_9EUKA|nr:hypothetical protein TRFO_16775 [Tritrichomonas foetus]|eukprot:OHT13208.1 hypothetical protein TRFO_16775 [Tritrichomonas foetus]
MNIEIYDFLVDLKNFTKIRTIGRGTFGVVSLYRENSTGKEYAIKELQTIESIDDKKQYLKEVVILAKMNWISILSLRGFTLSNDPLDPPCILTDFMPKGSLDAILRDEQNGLAPEGFDSTAKGKIIFRIATALMYLHDRGGCHRDLKPANILLNENYDAFLSDFGLATLDMKMTRRTQIKGTQTYMAPELFEDDTTPDEKIDIYAFALIVYEMVTLNPPFSNLKNPYAIPQYVLSGKRPVIDSSVCDEMRMFIEQCWDSSPKNRPSARAIVNHLMKYNLFPDADQEQLKYDQQLIIGDKLPQRPPPSEHFDYNETRPNSPSNSSNPNSNSTYSNSAYSFTYTKSNDTQTNTNDNTNDCIYNQLSHSLSSPYSHVFEKSPKKVNDNLSNTYNPRYSTERISTPYSFVNEKTNKSQSTESFEMDTLKQQEEKANDGNILAQYSVGMSYLNGYSGAQKDEHRGIYYLKLAANNRHSDACLQLAKIFLTEGTYHNNYDGVKYLAIAAESGNDKAQVWLGDLYCTGQNDVIKNQEKGIRLLLNAMKTVDDDSSFNIIGYHLFQSKNRRYYPDARRCFRSAAIKNNIFGMFNYAYMVEFGEGGKQDFGEAFKWYNNAAERDCPQACLRLGEIYETGKCLRSGPDLNKALEMYNKAKNLDCKQATKRIRRILQQKEMENERMRRPRERVSIFDVDDDFDILDTDDEFEAHNILDAIMSMPFDNFLSGL